MMRGEAEGSGMERVVDPVAVGPGGLEPSASRNGAPSDVGPGAADGALAVAPVTEAAAAQPGPAAAPLSGPDASLLSLVDRLAAVLERSDLGELEIGSGGTTIVLRAPVAIERPAAPSPAEPSAPAADAGAPAPAPAPAARPSVKAPLTGIYYSAPSPGATAYVRPGDQVAVGQLIGLIEAMKLFNEIKSDLAGRVVKVCAENGALVKAKQPLIEVEPL
jgi:acetyl-CoA carboxylase biotin carboxyl carrier protein